jgi:hypothetical protein
MTMPTSEHRAINWALEHNFCVADAVFKSSSKLCAKKTTRLLRAGTHSGERGHEYGLTPDEIAALRAEKMTGTRPTSRRALVRFRTYVAIEMP